MIDINEILHCSITSLDLRQSFEIGVNACTRRENRPISTNHFRFVIRGGQRLEARPEKVISDFHLTFSINPAKHSRLEIRVSGRRLSRNLDPTNQSPTFKPRNSTAFAFFLAPRFSSPSFGDYYISSNLISTFLYPRPRDWRWNGNANHRGESRRFLHPRNLFRVLARILGGKKEGAWKIAVESRNETL